MDAKFFGDTAAEIGKIKTRRPLHRHPSTPAPPRFAIDLATVIPHKIHGSRLAT
jgi:hypothetical protein